MQENCKIISRQLCAFAVQYITTILYNNFHHKYQTANMKQSDKLSG